ncbi:hypothetical protein AVEN_14069-1 [Araneus ventricosus]|uniref:Uncharacterized protein n=1 Tax=Araneus ventricosus TaxID=182803 RepID=A0A4Y2J0H7_ARAVE|nr:hypothetical protein AVEN_14069-1 [Araneus ventricosus]
MFLGFKPYTTQHLFWNMSNTTGPEERSNIFAVSTSRKERCMDQLSSNHDTCPCIYGCSPHGHEQNVDCNQPACEMSIWNSKMYRSSKQPHTSPQEI